MHQCLRCNQPHTETSLFCGSCQEALLNRYQQKEQTVNQISSLVDAKLAYIREPKLLKLSLRPVHNIQERKPEREHLLTSLEVKTPQPRYNPVVLKRMRMAFTVLVILALLALVVDSVLALIVITHKPYSMRKVNTPYASSSVPPIVPIQMTPQHTSTPPQSTNVSNTNGPDDVKKSAGPSNALTGQLAPSQGGGGPALAVSSSSLSFSLTQGQANPPAQIVTIVNTGVSSLNWLTTATTPSWFVLSSTKGSVVAGQSGQIKVSIISAGLNPGIYTAELSITATDSAGMDAQGSPQIVAVSLTIFQPCSLQVSPASISFTGTTLQLASSTQNIYLKEVGHCAQSVTWVAKVDAASQGWLNLSSTSGSVAGSGNTIVVSVNTNGMLPGSYKGQISCSTTGDAGPTIQGSRQIVAVTLEIRLAGIL